MAKMSSDQALTDLVSRFLELWRAVLILGVVIAWVVVVAQIPGTLREPPSMSLAGLLSFAAFATATCGGGCWLLTQALRNQRQQAAERRRRPR